MKYEIAKQLKDAGFPQKGGKSHEAFYLNAGILTGVVDFDMYKDVDDAFRSAKLVYAPTLEEIIEACGKTLFGELSPFKDEWRVMGGQHAYDDDFHEMQYEYVLFGSTMSDAVARLWLALNAK